MYLDSCEYFFYNKEGRLSYTGSDDGEQYDLFEYLDDGTIKKTRKGTSEKAIFKNGKGIERIYSHSGNKWKYTFNKKGLLVKSENESQDSWAEFDYDKNGLPSAYRSYREGKLKWGETYTYEYYEKK